MDPQLYDRFFEIEERFWWSVGTRRVFRRLAERVLPAARARVLDVGCGTGIMLRELPARGRLIAGCDASPAALAYSRRRGLADLVRADASRLPVAGDAVDLVLALDVIEHLEADEAAVREMARVCRPGGYVLLHVPAFPILWSDKDVLNHHRRRYRRRALAVLVRRCGLRIEQLSYLNCALLPAALARALWQRRGRPPVEDGAASVDRLYDVPTWLNRLLTAWMAAEGRAMRLLPFGMSLLCLARKPPADPLSRTTCGRAMPPRLRRGSFRRET